MAVSFRLVSFTAEIVKKADSGANERSRVLVYQVTLGQKLTLRSGQCLDRLEVDQTLLAGMCSTTAAATRRSHR